MILHPDDYISMPAMVIGGDLHGSVVEPGRASIEMAKFKAPKDLYDSSGDTRPFADDVIDRKVIYIEKIHFQLPFAIDDSDGTTKEAVMGLLNSILRDIQMRMMEEIFAQENTRRDRTNAYWRFRQKSSILDRRSWVTDFFNKFFPKKKSKHWELNG